MNSEKNQHDALQQNDELNQIRSLVQKTKRTNFSPFFAEKVVNRIRKQQDSFDESLLWSFKRIALAGAFAIAILLVLNFWNGTEITQPSYDLSNVTIEDAVITSFAASLEEVL